MATARTYRARMKKLMAQTVADQAQYGNWGYVFARPQKVAYVDYSHLIRYDSDCGDYCRIIAHLAGVPDDPAGTGYADYGNTSSIWSHLPHAPLEQAEVGDIFTFGFSTGEHHACMVYDTTNKSNPTIANMGCPGQPVLGSLAGEIAGHAGMTVTLCKIKLPPDPPPTPEDLLREQTGFTAWFKWREGEGAWKPYGAKNRTVRPDVPRVIPASWWRKRVAYLARRKKGTKPAST